MGSICDTHLGEFQKAVLLVSETCKSGLALLSPQSLVGKPDVEVASAKPQEDGLGCHHLLCKSSAFGHKATSSLFVEKALTTCSLLADSLLVSVGGTLVKEALAVSGLLFVVSSLLVEMALVGRHLKATALVLPKGIDCPLPILVGVFREGASPMKNGPPVWFWWQQPGSLLVFAQGGTDPIVWGIAYPVRSAWRRL